MRNRNPRRRSLSVICFLLVLFACCALAGNAEGRGGAGLQSSDTFGVGERIPTFPRDLSVFSCSLSNASVRYSDGTLTATIGGTGRIECSDYAYTCDTGSCEIVDQVVTAGIVRRQPTGGGTNSPPRATGSIPAQTMTVGGAAASVDVARYFTDADGDRLTYSASSNRTRIVRAAASGSTVTLTPVAAGTATVTVTARDPDGASATQSIAVTVDEPTGGAPFTDDPLVRGVTPVRAVHFQELRSRVDALRARARLSAFAWTDVLTADATPIRRIHVTELRVALAEAYAATGRSSPPYSDAVVTVGATPIRAQHISELRAAVVALETAPNREPQAVGSVPAQTLTIGGGRLAVDVAPYFDDPDRDPLSYEAESSDTGIVTVSVSGSTVTLAPVADGTATVTVSARDEEGLSASQTVSVRVRGPDLVLGPPTVTDDTPEADGSFGLSITVENAGAGDAPGTTLRYYRSSDPVITTSDTQVGTDSVSRLAAGASELESITLTAPASAGTYYYGACVEPVRGESDTGNNCSAGVRVTVEALQADLVVESPRVSSATVEAGASFTLSVTVRNGGDGGAGSTTLRYYRSSDPTISTGDTAVGTDSVPRLAAGVRRVESISLRAPSSAGTYYYGACVQAVDDESDGGNNCSSGVRVSVEVSQPDLVVESPRVSSARVEAGASFTLSVTVRNRGDGAARSTTLRYYRSSNSTISTSDTAVGTDSVSRLAAGASASESISLRAPSSAGTYYYGACVDPASSESNTDNNCSAGVRVAVESGGSPIEGEVTSCRGRLIAPSLASITMEGTIRAIRSVTSVVVTGTVDGAFLGTDDLGSIEAGRSKNFRIAGNVSVSGTSVRCEARVRYREVSRASAETEALTSATPIEGRIR